MSRAFLALTALGVLPGCWWNTGVEQGDSWDESNDPVAYPQESPESSEFFSPDWWTLEIWGLYDGQRLTDFRYHASSSGAVPAFAILRFTDPQWPGEEECYWSGQVKVQGWTVLTDDQYVAWGVTLEEVDTNCRDFDRALWQEDSPQTLLEGLYWTIGYRPPTDGLGAALDRDYDGPLSWADRYDDKAFTLQLGFERELGVWEHFIGGAAYALSTHDGDIVEWDHWGRPYPLDLGSELQETVIAAGTLEPQEIGLLGVQ